MKDIKLTVWIRIRDDRPSDQVAQIVKDALECELVGESLDGNLVALHVRNPETKLVLA